MRRTLRGWSAASAGTNGDGKVSAAAAGGAPSYQELVASFGALCAAAEDGGAEAGAVDVASALKAPGILDEAVALARENVVEWIDMQVCG